MNRNFINFLKNVLCFWKVTFLIQKLQYTFNFRLVPKEMIVISVMTVRGLLYSGGVFGESYLRDVFCKKGQIQA